MEELSWMKLMVEIELDDADGKIELNNAQ